MAQPSSTNGPEALTGKKLLHFLPDMLIITGIQETGVRRPESESQKNLRYWPRKGTVTGHTCLPAGRQGTWYSGTAKHRRPGAGVPPLPIPNREVKPCSADGTGVTPGRVGRRLHY